MIAEPTVSLGTGEILGRLGGALLLVLANGFFVAAEFALVGARRTRIEALAEAGNARAQMARSAIGHLDHYISGTQLGITLSSLALGWVGESTVAAILMQAFDTLPPPWNTLASHTVAVVVAFALITFLHIVLGELAPKSLALLFPEQVSLWTAAPLIAFSKLFSPFIRFLNGSANLLLRTVGLRAPHEAERVHRPEEIEMLLDQSFAHGFLAQQPVEMIRGVFDLSETRAAEVMTPRTQIVAVPATATAAEVEETLVASGHSRIPVYEGSIDRVVGVILARDFWRARREGWDGSVREILRPVPFVPESKDIEHLLREMRAAGVHIAIVLDEYGGTAGLVTVEDLIEEIVGEIQDEHEQAEPEIAEIEPHRFRIAGRTLVADVNARLDLNLPADEYATAAGYVMGQLGRLAQSGDAVEFGGGRFEVLGMSGRRIDSLFLELQDEEAAEGAKRG